MANEKKSARDTIRAQVLGNAPKPDSQLISLFGSEIELRQPTLASILAAQDMEDEQERSVYMIIEYAYVPGTNERVFEPTDKDVILKWPFGEDLVKLQLAITELVGVDVDDAEEDLQKNPLKGQS